MGMREEAEQEEEEEELEDIYIEMFGNHKRKDARLGNGYQVA